MFPRNSLPNDHRAGLPHPVPRPTRLALAIRGAAVAASSATYLLPAAAGAAVLLPLRGRTAAARFFYRRLVRHLQRLGPAPVKFGQIMGTRRDLLPPLLCDELGRLHDRVRPMTDRQTRRALRVAYGTELDRLFSAVDTVARASGSIAGVYRATRADGRVVALKLQRPGIRRRMSLDLALIRGAASLAERLPPARGVPLAELTGFVCAAVLNQLDFTGERANLAQLRRNFAGADHVWIPETLPELCRPTCLAMEYIPDLVTRPITEIDLARRPRLAARTVSAVYQMLFLDGFVHCDLHPGNVYFKGPRVVILDAGFSIRLDATVRRQFADFFLGLALGQGRKCGQVVVDSAVRVAPDADVEGFVSRVAELVGRNTGLPAREFQLTRFGTELFTLQRDFGLYAASEFIFPLLSLLVIEGTVRDLDPDIDFQAAARPMLLRAAAATAHLAPQRRVG
ncbi:AarF/ABC1/UbiB kinase family protein [Salinispora sp. H7-4]|uniref:ABC1 kinase family protein n=1 Tax=Salinispora sp. H7-4 TaxID=2748321 RepID=UPI0015D3C79F|nr:AarF/UbiB family protein [Salinispora sp. H7-4]NYT95307.1 AarF/ABC1/UbiB kinase family protein [Salinispora sp. H7-4]